jgi:hypothetical protein
MLSSKRRIHSENSLVGRIGNPPYHRHLVIHDLPQVHNNKDSQKEVCYQERKIKCFS